MYHPDKRTQQSDTSSSIYIHKVTINSEEHIRDIEYVSITERRILELQAAVYCFWQASELA